VSGKEILQEAKREDERKRDRLAEFDEYGSSKDPNSGASPAPRACALSLGS
jgi:hypothetical protein